MDDQSNDDVTEHLPAESAPDGFAVFEHMLKLIADPQSFARRMGELKRSIEAVADGEAKLAADRAAFDQHEKAIRAELAEAQQKVRARETAIFVAEEQLKTSETARQRNLAEREAMLDAYDRASDPYQPVGGLTKEPEHNWRAVARPYLKPMHVHGGLTRERDETEARNQRNVAPAPGPYVETDQNKLPMPKRPSPRGRARRSVRVALA